MGLDMYVYEASRPNLDQNKIYGRDELKGFCVEADEINQSCSDLIRYCQKVKVAFTNVNVDKLEKHILEEKKKEGVTRVLYQYISGVSDNLIFSVLLRYSDNTIKQFSYEMDRSTLISDFTVEDVVECYVCDLKEIKCWRKAYKVQDFFYDNISGIENCGFYEIPEYLAEEYNKVFGDIYDEIDISAYSSDSYETGNSCVVYHEWY